MKHRRKIKIINERFSECETKAKMCRGTHTFLHSKRRQTHQTEEKREMERKQHKDYTIECCALVQSIHLTLWLLCMSAWVCASVVDVVWRDTTINREKKQKPRGVFSSSSAAAYMCFCLLCRTFATYIDCDQKWQINTITGIIVSSKCSVFSARVKT